MSHLALYFKRNFAIRLENSIFGVRIDLVNLTNKKN